MSINESCIRRPKNMKSRTGNGKVRPSLTINTENLVDMTEILPNLFVGASDASFPQNLKYNKIQRIVNCTINLPNVLEKAADYKYYRVGVFDSASDSDAIYEHFQPAAKFIHESLMAGERVLVHCQMGLSRSPALVIAYLILYKQMSFEQAYSFVYNKRHIVPNSGFNVQLIRLEVSGREQLNICFPNAVRWRSEEKTTDRDFGFFN